jgi:hypothetical protein
MSAREALVSQIADLESVRGRTFAAHKQPNAVIAVAVLVDDLATLATAGDFLATYNFRDESGDVVAAACSEVDAYSESGVYATLLGGLSRLYQVRMRPGSWLCLGSDGLIGSVVPGFKRRFSSFLRYEGNTPHPEQRLLHNPRLILRLTPPERAALALFDVSMGRCEIPGLGPVACELDNKTALAAYQAADPAAGPFQAPESYAPLNRVLPADQYVYDTAPFRLRLAPSLRELYIGHALHPDGLPIMVLPDQRLEPLHARVAREDEGDLNRFFVEKLVGRGRIVLFDRDDHKIAAISRKGARHEVRPGDLIRLTPTTFLRFGGA